MSSTIVYAAFEDGDLLELGRASNAFQGAMHVWRTPADKYLIGGASLMFADLDALWRLSTDPRLTVAERLVHVSTFDCAYVRAEHMLELADALAEFMPSTDNLRTQAALIRDAHERGARVVAWQQTTVAVDLWCPPDRHPHFNVNRDPLAGPEVGVDERGGRLC